MDRRSAIVPIDKMHIAVYDDVKDETTVVSGSKREQDRSREAVVKRRRVTTTNGRAHMLDMVTRDVVDKCDYKSRRDARARIVDVRAPSVHLRGGAEDVWKEESGRYTQSRSRSRSRWRDVTTGSTRTRDRSRQDWRVIEDALRKERREVMTLRSERDDPREHTKTFIRDERVRKKGCETHTRVKSKEVRRHRKRRHWDACLEDAVALIE
jgi:hypothetical protein